MRESMIPEGWRKTTLGEVGIVQSGGTPSTKESSYWDGDIAWITPKDLSEHKGVYISRGERSITEEGLRNSSARLLPKNTVLFSSRAPIGYVAIASNEVCTNQGFKNVICDEKESHYKFFYYYMIYKTPSIEGQSSGSTFSEASAKLINSIEINLPPIEEQRAIAKVLSTLDDKITLLQEQNETLETLAQTLYQKEFGQYKVGDELPDGWRVGKLGDISKHIKISLNPNTTDQSYFHYSLPAFDKEQEPYLENGESIKSSKYKVQDNCFLVSKLNPFTPRIWTVFSVDKNAICSTEFQVVQPDEVLYFGMIHCFLNSDLYTKKISEKIKGTSSSHQRVNPKDIFESEIVIPSTEKLVSFNEIVMRFLLKKEKNKIQMKTLKETRDSLLTKLMSGEVRVKM